MQAQRLAPCARQAASRRLSIPLPPSALHATLALSRPLLDQLLVLLVLLVLSLHFRERFARAVLREATPMVTSVRPVLQEAMPELLQVQVVHRALRAASTNRLVVATVRDAPLELFRTFLLPLVFLALRVSSLFGTLSLESTTSPTAPYLTNAQLVLSILSLAKQATPLAFLVRWVRLVMRLEALFAFRVFLVRSETLYKVMFNVFHATPAPTQISTERVLVISVQKAKFPPHLLPSLVLIALLVLSRTVKEVVFV
jgi:hypothetical protein